MRSVVLLLILFIGLWSDSSGQSNAALPSTQPAGPRAKTKSPSTAAWLSAVMPGAGQVYNGKNWWWKVPIIYGAGIGLAYGVWFYNDNYNAFQQAYKYRIEHDVDVNGVARFDKFQTPTLKVIRDSYRQARDECALYLVLTYTLNIMDAAVEAHLLEFNVSDDLSLKVEPIFVPYDQYAYAGVQFKFNIK